jgi:hypothetical protein
MMGYVVLRRDQNTFVDGVSKVDEPFPDREINMPLDYWVIAMKLMVLHTSLRRELITFQSSYLILVIN